MKFSEAINVTIVSMLIVFLVLIVIMFMIKIQTYLVELFSKINRKKEVAEIEESMEVQNNKDEILEQESSEDDLEIVAAITAALSCYMDVPEDKLIIKSIKRSNTNNSTWSDANLNI